MNFKTVINFTLFLILFSCGNSSEIEEKQRYINRNTAEINEMEMENKDYQIYLKNLEIEYNSWKSEESRLWEEYKKEMQFKLFRTSEQRDSDLNSIMSQIKKCSQTREVLSSKYDSINHYIEYNTAQIEKLKNDNKMLIDKIEELENKSIFN